MKLIFFKRVDQVFFKRLNFLKHKKLTKNERFPIYEKITGFFFKNICNPKKGTITYGDILTLYLLIFN